MDAADQALGHAAAAEPGRGGHADPHVDVEWHNCRYAALQGFVTASHIAVRTQKSSALLEDPDTPFVDKQLGTPDAERLQPSKAPLSCQ